MPNVLLPMLIIGGIVSYFHFFSPEKEVRPHILWRPISEPLRKGDHTSQSNHIWNFGAPLANQVADRVSKRDYRDTRTIPSDLYEFPRSILLHEANLSPTNITIVKLFYQLFLFLSGAFVMKVYVLPLF
jgi:hypothetical protein